MLYRFDGLSRDPLSPADLREILRNHSSFWVALDGGCDGVFFLGDGHCLELIAADSAPTGFAVVDDSGRARLAVVRAAEAPSVAAWVRTAWCGVRRYPLTRFPWRPILRMKRPRRAWIVADFFSRLAIHVRWLFRQYRPPLSSASVDAEMDRVYSHDFSSAIYDNFAGIGLHEDERIVADKFLKSGERVLDIGCGTGREAFAFARRGLTVVGVDVSARMVESARRHAQAQGLEAQATFQAAPMLSLDFPAESFDAVFIACDVYSRTTGRANRVEFLRRCRETLRPGGRVMAAAVPPAAEPLRTRLLVDGPRRLLAPIGPRLLPEIGDRWNPGPNPEESAPVFFKHRFRSDEEIMAEFRDAGFASPVRCSSFIVGTKI